jgi:N-methylhydantoinase B/oxoprolinase/acetone carboxylase alpha subunit
MPWVTVCYAALYVYSHGFWDLPVCMGSLAPIDFRIPDGSILSANWDAAISFAPPLCENVHLLLTQIFARMMFSSEDRQQIAGHTAGVTGGSGGMWTGVNQWGVPYTGESTWSQNTSGQGARVNMDGMDSALFASAVHAVGSDAEEVEVDHPVIHFWQRHQIDSPGHGKYRGGASGYTATALYGVPYLKRGSEGYKGRMPVGQGIFGGYPSYSPPSVTIDKTNLLELMAKGERNLPTSIQEAVTEKVIKGDYQIQMTERPAGLVYEGALRESSGRSGGHGYGDVLERQPQAVVDDVRDEIISDWAAANVYHVAYDAETWTADEEKTEELRKQEREDRLRRAKSYDEFEKEWLKKKPPEDMLTYYGSWPDGKVVRPIIRI